MVLYSKNDRLEDREVEQPVPRGDRGDDPYRLAVDQGATDPAVTNRSLLDRERLPSTAPR
jgi:hypothetical protein